MMNRVSYEASKRTIDLLVGSLSLLVTALLMAAIALAIKLTSPGPALFKQERVGRAGQRFALIKFRSMVDGNDASPHLEGYRRYVAGDLVPRPGSTDEPVYLINDPRITRVGAFLRRTSLDELPNLWNVVKGDMSLVGPRPPLPYEVEMYDDRALQRLEVKPGITGLAQVNGRGTLSFEQVINFDLEYIQRRSLVFDLRIMLRTIPAALSQRGT
jgi:lipopolysaccharide/colanic/teichoic acid biosynthesis glycosyltransferase